jgi:hypothetical protein
MAACAKIYFIPPALYHLPVYLKYALGMVDYLKIAKGF